MISPVAATGGQYRHFAVAVYVRAYEVEKMQGPEWLATTWQTISRQVKVDKIYIETHRDRRVPSDETLRRVKRVFAEQGVRTAGGIALVVDEPNRFETPCYTDPGDRAFVREIVEHTARHFDEIILDDFFFTSTKRDSDIAAKGERRWSEFRLDLMRAVSEELVLQPARAVNPAVRVIIKYPNWYEHFQGLGFDLERQPAMFDGIYTGTETRQPFYNAQHLQPYESYGIVRYFENIAPGRNGGGWVDQGSAITADRYAEQLWLTLFAKAPEMTLFAYHELLRPLPPTWRAAWQDGTTSFDFDRAIAPFRRPDGAFAPELTTARVAGAALEQVDAVLGALGTPTGIASYRPPHATGEDFLHNYLGMVGIPIDLRPEFPAEADPILLTESAKHDAAIVEKIEAALRAGKTVTITSGLLAALQDRGIQQIVEWRTPGKRVLADEFYRRGRIFRGTTKILLPQIEYFTNDSWEIVGAHANGSPLLLQAAYSRGTLNALAVPDNPADLYQLPAEVLALLRETIAPAAPVRIEAPAQVALFTYDNDTLIVESFLPEPVAIHIVAGERFAHLRDLTTGERIVGTRRETPAGRGTPADSRSVFDVPLRPHSYRAFALEA